MPGTPDVYKRQLGEGDQKKADRYFTMFLLAAAISVSVLAVLGLVLLLSLIHIYSLLLEAR